MTDEELVARESRRSTACRGVALNRDFASALFVCISMQYCFAGTKADESAASSHMQQMKRRVCFVPVFFPLHGSIFFSLSQLYEFAHVECRAPQLALLPPQPFSNQGDGSRVPEMAPGEG